MEKTAVMKEFEDICKVPRYSFHNDKIIAYCIKWAKDHGFEYIHDDTNGNVIIRKAAAPGKEDRPGIVLQGHLDMVAQTDPGVEHDWDNEGIDFYIDGDMYRAHGTTLGADDAVAPAISFALLTSPDLQNPPLEVLLTTDEEVGMLSVKDADLTVLGGRYLLNIDSGPEGVFTVGCAGGCQLQARVPNEKEPLGEGQKVYQIEIGGLKGGHSGIEITKERGNALKILGELLYAMGGQIELRICDLKAEGKDNAISDNVLCHIATSADQETVAGIVSACEKDMKFIFREADPDLYIRVSEGHAPFRLREQANATLASLLHLLPFGVQHFEQSLKSVESSLNLGLVETDERYISIIISIRSSVQERRDEICGHIRDLCRVCGAVCEEQGKSYPAWTADYDNDYLKKVSDIYKDMYGHDPVISATHGGLECGYIMTRSNIEAAIAIGPYSEGEHTTTEALSVSSLNRTFEFVKKVIETL